MRWQNLLHKKCPKCDGRLVQQKDKAILYTCESCDFCISRRTYAQILADPNHIMRRFLTPDELHKLTDAVEKMYATE